LDWSFIVFHLTDGYPDVAFTVAIGVLAVLASLAASIPTAMVAAYRDPLRLLRVP
jgi:putative ABC transport system permease protein